ncbi:MAG: response regulator transcription factor [Deltaproteobacteria bacterium]|nr:response regulator transcription factor [Deltaproteobacteria bacterium]
MGKKKILAVDDEEDILELIVLAFTKENFEVLTADTGEKALAMVRTSPPDVILLDLMLPGIDGLEVARQLKADTSSRRIPIVMVTAKGSEADVVTGLELGADEYVTKPFSPKVLVTRVKAVLRRASTIQPQELVMQFRDLVIRPERREVLLKGRPVQLTLTEFNILRFLAERPGWVFSRGQIVAGIHGNSYPVTERSVDVQVVSLRRKLGKSDAYVETVRGVGYRFKDGS